MTFAKTLKEARAEVEEHLVVKDPGIRCPCCDQFCKLYTRKLNSQIARWIIWLVREYEKRPRWIDWHDAPSTLRGGDYAKAAHWGLIINRPNKSAATRTSGYWKPTQAGIDFAHDRITLASHVYLYNNEVRGFTKKQTTIVDALGKHFNYQELMHS